MIRKLTALLAALAAAPCTMAFPVNTTNGPRAGITRAAREQIIFIDSRVPDLQKLTGGVKPGEQVVVLEPASDGVQQIADIILTKNLHDLPAIHIVSHGLEGEISLGSITLTGSTLAEHAAALNAIGKALAPGGDILLYGCSVGHGLAGGRFLSDLMTSTGGADIAASTHPVGTSPSGVNWSLDVSTGHIEAEIPFSAGALAAFQGTLAGTLTGQLWFVSGGNPSDTSAGHINSDAGNPTLGPPFPEAQGSIGLDLPAGYYFTVSTDHLFIEAHRVSDGAKVDELQIGDAAGAGTLDDDLVNALAVDPINETIYVGKWGQTLAQSGIVAVSYNATTGLLNHSQAIGATQTRLVNGTQAGNITDPRYIDLETDGIAGGGNDFLYYSDNDNTYSVAPFSAKNGVYRIDLNNTAAGATLLSSQVQFPVSNTAGTIGPVAVDTAHSLIYFETHTLSTNAATLWWMPLAGGTATAVTLPAGTILSIGDFPTAGLTFDPQTHQLYVTVQSNIPQGFTQDLVYQGQLSADGHAITSWVNTTNLSVLVGHTPDPNAHVAGTSFDILPVLTVTGAATHAVEQGGFVDLTASNTSTDADNDHYASATVQITGGTFSSNENSTADDHLSVLDGATNRTSGLFTGTNITVAYDAASEKLTLTGYDTIANYNNVLGRVQYNTTGDNPTNYGANAARTITWTVSDGAPNVPSGGQNSVTTTLTIDAVNDAPVNIGVAAQTAVEDTNKSITGLSVADVDANPASHSLTTTLAVTNGTLTVGSVGGGAAVSGNTTTTVTLTGTSTQINTTLAAANNVVYRGVQDFFGGATLTVTTNDQGHTGSDPGLTGDGASEQDSDAVGITVSEVNDAPAAISDTLANVAEDAAPIVIAASSLTTNDSKGPANESTQTLTVTAVSAPVGGTVVLSAGNVTFTLTPNFNGAASFTYTVTDNGTTNGVAAPLTANGTVSFTVTEVNDAPVAVDDTLATVLEDAAPVVIAASSLATNDTKGAANESTQTLTVTAVSNPIGGTAVLSAGNVTFTLTPNFSGTASFDYTVSDNGTTNGVADPKTDVGTASFTVTSVNDNPVANADTITRFPTQPVKVAKSVLLANDTDPDGGTPAFVSVAAASANGGTVTSDATTVFYTPAAGFTGADTFTYTINDGQGGTANGTVTVAVSADPAQSVNVSKLETLGDGSVRVSFAGIPGRTYRVQSSDTLATGPWTDRLSIAADALGKFQFTDPPPLPPTRFYRSVQP